MSYIPHEKLSIDWIENEKRFTLSLPWVSVDVEVQDEDREWLKEATEHLHSAPANSNVQRLLNDFKDYPIFYLKPRPLKELKKQPLQVCPPLAVNSSTPVAFIETFGCAVSDELADTILPAWSWDRKAILSKAQIVRTDLYDPLSFVSYLICHRLEWESTNWGHQGGFEHSLMKLLKRDEDQFFQAIGWIAKQSWHVTTQAVKAMMPSLIFFNRAQEQIQRVMCDEAGHHKFMEEVFRELRVRKEDFPVEEGTKWRLAAQERTAKISPLAFSAMTNLLGAAYYGGLDVLSRVIKLSSKPQAAQGFDLHHRFNQMHRHGNVPLLLARHLAPQTKEHLLLTLSIFELSLHFLDRMKQNVQLLPDS